MDDLKSKQRAALKSAQVTLANRADADVDEAFSDVEKIIEKWRSDRASVAEDPKARRKPGRSHDRQEPASSFDRSE